MCIRTKPCKNSCMHPPLERIHDPCDDPEDIVEIDLVGELPNSNYSYVLTDCDVFSRYLLAVPLRKPDITSVVCALLQVFEQHAYVTERTNAPPFPDKSWLSSCNPSEKKWRRHSQTRPNHRHGWAHSSKAETGFKMQRYSWHTAMEPIGQHNTTNHQSIKCPPTKVFHKRVSHNAQDLEFSNPVHTRCTETKLKTLVNAVNQKYKENISFIFAEFYKYLNYYDRKAQAQSLKVGWLYLPTQPQVQHTIRQNPVQDVPLERPIQRNGSSLASKPQGT